MESLVISMVGFPLQVWKYILFLSEKVNLCADFSKTQKKPQTHKTSTQLFLPLQLPVKKGGSNFYKDG